MTDSDDHVQRAVLGRLLDLGQLTIEELIRDLGTKADHFAERDPIERAIRDLARAGLANRHGSLVAPSRAASRFDELIDGC